MPISDATRVIRRSVPRLVPVGAATAVGLRAGGVDVRGVLRSATAARRGPILLTLDLTRPLRPDTPGLAALRARGRPSLREVVDVLSWAAEDHRVAGLLARIGPAPGGLATVQELAAAVRGLVDTGRPCIAHAEAFGEAGNGTLSYLLASAFGEVHLQPTGDLALLGISGEVTFLRGALDRVGIEPQFDHRHEYKNAADTLTEHGFTPAHREALDSLVEDWSSQVVDAVAAARRLDAAAVRDAIDSAPLLADEAVERGLVDRLAYLDESLAQLRGRVAADATLVPIDRYGRPARMRHRWHERSAPRVAVIDAVGAITVRGDGGLLGTGITSDRLCAELRRVAEDDDVAAVILRIDSPGGSAVASDAIRREILRTRRAGTPVVAWMGDVAGSGGYFIAMPADCIIAQPGTLTGSIGVISGKAVRAGLEERLGVHTEAVTRGAHARFYSATTPFSATERERLERQLDRVYDDFTAKVAEDRRLPIDRVHRVARGRIWTGAQAHAHGLVDRLGGHREALDAIRGELGLQPGAPLRLRRHRPARSVMARLRGEVPPDPAQRDAMALLAAVAPGEVASWLGDVDLAMRPAGMLAMPWVPRLR